MPPAKEVQPKKPEQKIDEPVEPVKEAIENHLDMDTPKKELDEKEVVEPPAKKQKLAEGKEAPVKEKKHENKEAKDQTRAPPLHKQGEPEKKLNIGRGRKDKRKLRSSGQGSCVASRP